MAQINPTVGDVEGNAQKILSYVTQAHLCYRADMVIFPELVITGYPPEDLLFREDFLNQVDSSIDWLKNELAERVPNIHVVIGAPAREQGRLFNAALVLNDGKILHRYFKQKLPNYQVFDECRYFESGEGYQSANVGIFKLNGINFGLSVCEDIWHEETVTKAVNSGVECIISINASPYHVGKQSQRIKHVIHLAQKHNVSIIYTNMVGGQDELVFDGASFAVNPNIPKTTERLVANANAFKEQLHPIKLTRTDFSSHTTNQTSPLIVTSEIRPHLNTPASIYSALVLGLKDYVNKSGFNSVILGLSGGIDSALTLAIAVDALGQDKVEAVMMPYDYTSQISKDDAQAQALKLGVRYRVLPIHQPFTGFMAELKNEPEFKHAQSAFDMTEQNLQARCRGVMLMALSNKKGSLVLTTGNKSEIAVGYCTLYGDMVGGFNPLKDVPKTLVYKLSEYRNTISPAIPERVITRPPSAELAPDQKDTDSLPPYERLDEIIKLYVDQDASPLSIIDKGFDPSEVEQVIRLIDRNEYKRQQAVIGTRISEKGFGRDRRYPVVKSSINWSLQKKILKLSEFRSI